MGAPAHGAPKAFCNASLVHYNIVYLYYILEAESQPPPPPLSSLTDEDGSELKSMIIKLIY